MPTLLDSFVLTLTLDPRGFSDGQKKAYDELRKFEEQAKRAGSRIEKAGTAGFVAFFKAVESPFASLRQHFERLAVVTSPTGQLQRNLVQTAAQARQAGTGVQAGALAGASGLRIMGIAGVAAFAAVAALSKAMSAAGEAAGGVFKAGLGAAAAGMNVREFTAMSQALLKASHVPEEITQGAVGGLQQRINLARRGLDQGALYQQLNLAGVRNVRPGIDTAQTTMNKIAEFLATLDTDEAITRGTILGLPDILSKALHDVGKSLPGLTAIERGRAVTPDQEKSALDLFHETDNLKISLGSLSRTIFTKLNPGFERLSDTLSGIIDKFGGSTVYDFINKTLKPSGPAPLYDAVSGWLKRRFGLSNSTSGVRGRSTSNSGVSDNGVTPQGPASIGYSNNVRKIVGALRDTGMGNAGITGAITNVLGEGGFLTNWLKSKAPGENSFGPWQFNDRGEGIDYRKFLADNPNEVPRSVESQARFLAQRMEQLHPGFKNIKDPLEATRIIESKFERHAGPMGRHDNNVRAAGELLAKSGATRPQAVYGAIGAPGVKVNSKGQPYAASLEHLPADQAQRVKEAMASIKESMKTGVPWWEHKVAVKPLSNYANPVRGIQRTNALQGPAPIGPTNHNYGDVNTGDIHVHTRATEPQAVGGAVSEAVKRLVVQANTAFDH